MGTQPSRILCVDNDRVLQSRCAVLERSGYDAFPSSVNMAPALLRTQHYDLVILSATINGEERRRIVADAGDSQIVALKGLTQPTELLSLVAERLGSGEPSLVAGEGIARFDLAGLKASIKPVHTLLRSAVRE